MGLELWNALSSAGAAMVLVGGVVLLVDVARHFRPTRGGENNPWEAGTAEWLPNEDYGPRSIPRITGRYPLWDNPRLREEVEAGRHFLPGTLTGKREALITSAAEALPQYVAVLPGAGFAHLVAAIGTAGFFLSLAVSAVIPAGGFAVLALAGFLRWLWTGTDLGPLPARRDGIGEGLDLPNYVTGPLATSWWAMVCLMLVSGTAYVCTIGSYLFLWLVNGDAMWPPAGMGRPVASWGGLALAGYAASAGVVLLASGALRRRNALPPLAMPVALALLAAGFAADLLALWEAGLRPSLHAHAAASYALATWQGTHVGVAVIMAFYVAARAWAGKLDGTRRLSFDNVMLFWLYTVGQGIAGLALLHGFPRLLA